MLDLFIQVLALFLMLGGVALGYWRWVRPRQGALSLQGVGLLLLVVLTMMGALVGSPFWWADDERSFSWNTPPLASRMLGAAAWSFVVVAYLALRRPSYRRVRLVLLLVFIYLFPLTVAILTVHLDRFDFTDPITYAFFTIVVFMDVASAWYLLRQPTIQPDQPRDTEPSTRVVRMWMLFVAGLLGLWGAALFASNDGPIQVVWVWKYDMLSTRLIGVMLLAVAAGLVYSFRFRDAARVMLTTLVAYGVGVTAASLWSLVADESFPVSYFVLFGSLALVSLLLIALHQESEGSGAERSDSTDTKHS